MVILQQRQPDDTLSLVSTESALAERFPEVPGEVIHRLVQDSYRSLTPARVQSFLPILITRTVQTTLLSRRAEGLDTDAV